MDKILNTDVQSFIDDNLKKDLNKLLLKGSPFETVCIKEIVEQIQAKIKAKSKLPTWFNHSNILYPPKISIEQTSSEQTALYKSNLIEGETLIDITGGFGVDIFYFSKRFKEVFHCEINEKLSKIVQHNFKVLGVKNVTSHATDGIEFLRKTGKKFDYIYVDPSRRNDLKGKVFLLKDCLPNILENIDFLFTKTEKILIKNSPILDITSTIKEVPFVKEVHIIAVTNEVKEFLVLLERNYVGDINIKTVNITKSENQIFEYCLSDLTKSSYEMPLKYLYEPNLAIMKSGGFGALSEQFKIAKLHPNSHLYTSEKLIKFPGRSFEIITILPYNKKQILKLIPNKKINITTRNFPKTVAQIRKETKLKDGGKLYMFCTKNIENKNIVIICKSITVI